MPSSANEIYADGLLRAVEESLFGGTGIGAAGVLRGSVLNGGVTPSFLEGYADLAARELSELRRTRRHGAPAREPRLFTALVSALDTADAWIALAPAVRAIMVAEAIDAHSERHPRVIERCSSSNRPLLVRLDPSLSSIFYAKIARAAGARSDSLRAAAFEAALAMLEPPTSNAEPCMAFLAPRIAVFRAASGHASIAGTRDLIDTARTVFGRSSGPPPAALVEAVVAPLFSRAAVLAASPRGEERKLASEICCELRSLAERHPSIDLSGSHEALASLRDLLVHVERGEAGCAVGAVHALLALSLLMRAGRASSTVEVSRVLARAPLPEGEAAGLKVSAALDLCRRGDGPAPSHLIGEVCSLLSSPHPAAARESAIELLFVLAVRGGAEGAAERLLRSLLGAISGLAEEERSAAFSGLVRRLCLGVAEHPSRALEDLVTGMFDDEDIDRVDGPVPAVIAWMAERVEARDAWPPSARSLVLDAAAPLVERLTSRAACAGSDDGVLDLMSRVSVVRRFVALWAEGVEIGERVSAAIGGLDRSVLGLASRAGASSSIRPADASLLAGAAALSAAGSAEDAARAIGACLEAASDPAARRKVLESLAAMGGGASRTRVAILERAMAGEPAESAADLARAAVTAVFDELEDAAGPESPGERAVSLALRLERGVGDVRRADLRPGEWLLVRSAQVARARGLDSWLSGAFQAPLGVTSGGHVLPDEAAQRAAQRLLRNSCIFLYWAAVEAARRSDRAGMSALTAALEASCREALLRVPIAELGAVGAVIAERLEAEGGEARIETVARDLGMSGRGSIFERFERTRLGGFGVRHRALLVRLGAVRTPAGPCELARLLGDGRGLLTPDEAGALEREFDRMVRRPVSRLYSAYVRGFLAPDLLSSRAERVSLLRERGFYERLAEWGFSSEEDTTGGEDIRMQA